MMGFAESRNLGKHELQARPATTAGRRFATAAVVLAAMIVGVLGWRWVLVEATTDYGSDPESLPEPRMQPQTKHSPPPIELEVTAVDVRTASAAGPAAARVMNKSGAASPSSTQRRAGASKGAQ